MVLHEELGPEEANPERPTLEWANLWRTFQLKGEDRRELVAEAGADSHALAADRTAAAQNRCARLGLHARTETMGFHALAAVGLKGALGHETTLLLPDRNLRLDGKY